MCRPAHSLRLTQAVCDEYVTALRRSDCFLVCLLSGDTDPGINSMVTQSKYFDFFDSINVTESEPWRPWTLDGKQRMGGYVVSYPGDFTYLTIRGSGHMVPE